MSKYSRMSNKELVEAFVNDQNFFEEASAADVKRAIKISEQQTEEISREVEGYVRNSEQRRLERMQSDPETTLLTTLGAIALGCAIFHKD